MENSDCYNCGNTPMLMNKFNNMLNKKPKVQPIKHWGNSLWEFIHTICIIEPKYHLNVIENLKGITNVIPCKKCKMMYEHYLDLINELDLTKELVLFNWSVDLHNRVNEKLNKPIGKMSYEDSLKLYI